MASTELRNKNRAKIILNLSDTTRIIKLQFFVIVKDWSKVES